MVELTSLNEDVLLNVFKYCSETDRANLSKVSHKCEDIIEHNYYKKRCRDLLMTTDVKAFMEFEKAFGNIKYSERIALNKNWMSGQFTKTLYFQHMEIYTSLLQIDKNYLYKTDLGKLLVFQRSRGGINLKNKSPHFSNGSMNDPEIRSMISKDDILFGGLANGSVFTYSNENYNEESLFQNKEPINCVDFHENLFLATTKNSTKMLNITKELEMNTFDVCNIIPHGFKTIKCNPTGTVIVASKENQPGKYYFIDPAIGTVESTTIRDKNETLDIKWISEDQFLTTSPLQPLKLVDVRASPVINQLQICDNFTAVSMDYDGRFGVVYGSNLGIIVLVDLRKPKYFERIYHINCANDDSGYKDPLTCRSLVCDERHIYVTTDHQLTLLDFSD